MLRPSNGQEIRLPRVVASPSAHAALCRLRHDRGPLVIMLGSSATVSIARVCRSRDFSRDEDHVMLGTVAQCPVYMDIRYVESCLRDVLVVDLRPHGYGGDPLFVARPESRAERQQRMFAHRARTGSFGWRRSHGRRDRWPRRNVLAFT